MKRAGIITFHRAENFGAVMQTYALQETIKGLGADAYILDYKNRNIEAQYHIFNPAILWSRKNILASLKKYIQRFSSLNARIAKKKKYYDFRKNYLNIVPESFWRNCDLLVAGSDQIWNLHLTGGFDKHFFLNYQSRPGQKRISYGASSDKDPDDLLYKEKNRVQKALNELNSISVREEFLKTSLSRFIDRQIDIVLDPTFLLDEYKYDEIAVRPAETSYVCVYHMTPSDEARKLAEKIASLRNLKVVELYGGYDKPKSNNICKADISPAELLGYLKYADEIVTTSFHGIAFSIKFHKIFWAINKGDNFRQQNILALLGLSDRLVGNSDEAAIRPIDYTVADKKLQIATEKSISFISEWLK